MSDIRIIQMTHDDGEFYRLMGPFLSRREIVKELGGPIYDDDGKLWFIALDGDKVAGFAAILSEKNADHFCSTYVLPTYRGQGIYKRLIEERLAVITGIVTVTATAAAAPALLAAGFHPVTQSDKIKNYTKLIREGK